LSLRIGCSGWSYADWVGPFYPPNTKPDEYLGLYSKVFECVEVDSTFYRAPSPSMVGQWYSNTPTGFMFAPKLPKRMTHDQHLQDVSSYLGHFTRTMEQLREKLGPIVIQLPPSFKLQKDEKALANFITELNQKLRYAIEFRHKSWFNPTTQKLLESNNICQAWAVSQYLTTPAAVTSDIIYLRLVGDRKLTEFKETQRDQTQTMHTWKKALDEVAGSVKEQFVFFNNHFAGFGPASVNEFRRLMGLAELDWKNMRGASGGQRSLFDFSESG
jgi:uncharacterized protein YecE (DUF72 family)